MVTSAATPQAAVVAYDLGTNTFRWLAVAADGSALGRGRAVVGLGRGLHPDGDIAADRIAAGVAQLTAWRPGDGGVPNCHRVVAIGTHALRAAGNGDLVAARLGEALGHRVQIIDAHAEAAYTFAGAVHGTANSDTQSARVGVLDIGGGSTELAYGQGGRLLGSISLPIGVVTMAADHEPLAATILRIHAAVDAAAHTAYHELASSMMRSFHLRRLVANCGTASALAAMHAGATVYDRTTLDGYTVPGSWLRRLITERAAWTAADWARVPGIGPERGALIGPGIAILAYALAATALDSWTNCEAGLLEGLAATTLDLQIKDSSCST